MPVKQTATCCSCFGGKAKASEGDNLSRTISIKQAGVISNVKKQDVR